MKFYFWNKIYYDDCSHYGVFAESLVEAKFFVESSIRKQFEPSRGNKNKKNLLWLKKQENHAVDDFLYDPGWKLSVFEIEKGLINI